MKKKVIQLLIKYEKYIGNIEWHINTNQPWGSDLEKCQKQLECYQEIFKDLKAIINE